MIYSGTVAAAMEGRFLGLPAVAVSLVGERAQHFDAAAQVASDLVLRLRSQPLESDVILNVNVPNRPYEELAGLRATRLGFRHRSEPLVRNKDAHGRTIYWFGPPGDGQDAGDGTDFHAIDHGFVSVTPLKVDLTRHQAVPEVASWLDNS